jgi:hypothetical protein
LSQVGVRGKLIYVGNESRIRQCACEPVFNPPVDVLLAISSGTPDDITGATNYLKNIGWNSMTCVEVDGIVGTVGANVRVLFLQQIKHCPTGPCNQ